MRSRDTSFYNWVSLSTLQSGSPGTKAGEVVPASEPIDAMSAAVPRARGCKWRVSGNIWPLTCSVWPA